MKLWLPAVVLLLLASGCTWVVGSGRDLAQGFAEGFMRSAFKDSTRIALDTLSTRTARGIGRALQSELAPVLDSTIAGALHTAQGSLLTTADSLTARVDGPLQSAVTRSFRSAIAGGGQELRSQADPTLAALGEAADRNLRPLIVRTAGEAADTLSARLARHVATDLAVAFETLTTRSARAADRVSQESKTTKELRRTLAIAGGIVVLGLILFAIWLWRDRSKARRSLTAVAEVVNQPGNEYLKPVIKRETQRQDVETWFNTFLAKNKLL